MSTAITAIIIIAAIAIYVVLTVKGTSPIISALVATALVSFFAIGGFFSNFFTTFTDGMASMFGGFFIQFTFGTAFGTMLSACGAADRLGNTLARLMGKKNVVYVIIIVTILFGLTGAPAIALMPGITFGLLRSANLPRYIGLVAVTGGTMLSNIIPGNLSLPNMMPTNFLDTNVYSGALVGCIGAAVGLLVLCIECNVLMSRAQRNGIGYDERATDAAMREEDDMPSFLWSIIPVLFVLALCAVLTFTTNFESTWILVICTTGGMVIIYLANHKYIHESPLIILKGSAENIQHIIVCAVAVCGFAAVVSNTNAYESVISSILSWNIHPALIIVIGQMIIAALCADAISGIAAFMGSVGSSLAASGVNPVLIHRLANISCTTFDSMPHGGSVTMAITLYGYTLREGYKYLVLSNIVMPLIVTFVSTILCVIIY